MTTEPNTFTEETQEFVSVAEPTAVNSITPMFSDLSPQGPEKNPASNSGISGNSGSGAPTRKHDGQFAAARPWRFQPGQSGNPKGGPPQKKLQQSSDLLRSGMAETLPRAPDLTYSELTNSSSQIPANFSNIETLTLNGNVGNAKAPPATAKRRCGYPSELAPNAIIINRDFSQPKSLRFWNSRPRVPLQMIATLRKNRVYWRGCGERVGERRRDPRGLIRHVSWH